ncbi:MAG: amidohydrolase family protein [Ignavibacteria bacterium]|nr:amidohydrolase family protein [Ignavibacteria bacterium]
MDRYLIVKNALVLTFDKDDNVGYFNIVIKNNVIHHIDYYNDLVSDRNIYTKFPGVNIIDAKDKIIIPALFNSSINSTDALSEIFFERLNYDRLAENLSLALLNRHFSSAENKSDLKTLLTFTYFRALSNGELFLNEISGSITKEFLQEFHKYNFLIVQDLVFTSFSDAFNRYLNEINRFHCIGIRDESEITNYSLGSASKSLKEGKRKLLFEILRKSNGQEIIKKAFNKSLFKVLGENDFLDGRLIFSNPVNIQKDELEYLSDKKVNIILCPSDIVKLGEKKIESFDIIKYGLNVCLGTGYLGKAVITEMKLFSHLAKKGNISYRSILKMATVNPAKMFGVFNTHGSIEKNKIANLVLFDVADLRNYFISPEYNSEKVSEHIIENLDSKDISDIIVKGNVIRRDYRSKLFDTDSMKQNTMALSKKIIDIGKYYEFKEKYLMRKRIKELSTDNKAERKVFVSTGFDAEAESTESTKSIISDSEFRIIGLRKEINPINTLADDGIDTDNDNIVVEVDDVYRGFSFFSDADVVLKENPLKNADISEPLKKKIFFDDVGNIIESQVTDELKIIGESKDTREQTPGIQSQNGDGKKDKEKIVYKKNKMKFGFSDDDK